MGIFGNRVQTMIAGVAESMASLTNTYVHTGASISNPGTKNLRNGLGQNTDNYYDFLREFHFVEAILSIFSSTVKEAIKMTEFKVAVKDKTDSNIASKLNTALFEADIKNFLLSKCDDFIWRGSYSVALDKNTNKLIEITEPFKTQIISKGGKVIGYLYSNLYVPRTEMITYYYKADISKPLKAKDAKKIRDTEDNIDGKLKKFIVEYSSFEGYGMFKNQLLRLFQLYVLEYSLFFLSLRDTTQPELLGMSTGGNRINVAQSTNAANDIESLLNNPSLRLANIIDPYSFLNNLTYNILNYVKILPVADHYQNVSDVNYAGQSQKRDKLQAEHDNMKREILANLTIPEELFNGQSNRWEMISRNDRLMTTCDTLLESFARFVKDFCVSKCAQWDIPVKLDDITFNLEYASMLTSYDVKNKLQSVADRFMDLERVMQSVQNLSQLEYIKKEELHNYLLSQLSFADDKLKKVITDDVADMKAPMIGADGNPMPPGTEPQPGDEQGGDQGMVDENGNPIQGDGTEQTIPGSNDENNSQARVG